MASSVHVFFLDMQYFSPKWGETITEKGSEDREEDDFNLFYLSLYPFSVSWGKFSLYHHRANDWNWFGL